MAALEWEQLALVLFITPQIMCRLPMAEVQILTCCVW